MDSLANIIISDRSALHFYLHSSCDFVVDGADELNPLLSCARTSEELHAFNVEHPLYGGRPVELLVARPEDRRSTHDIRCYCTTSDLPANAFYQIRQGLHIASPELVYARLGTFGASIPRMAQVATDLCGRYYINKDGNPAKRPHFVSDLKKMQVTLGALGEMRGTQKTRSALKYAMNNSASPMETKTMLQFCLPYRLGGFNLPFCAMNFDIKAGRLAKLTKQGDFCLDLAAPKFHFGIEYDGNCHDDPSHDKRRLNELKALGWTVFPLDAQVLYNPDATIRAACQIAHAMGVRLRRGPKWPEAFVKLRHELDLPC